MEIKDLDLRPFSVPKNGKVKLYDTIKEQKRTVFFRYRKGNFCSKDCLVKTWFNQFGGGQKDFTLSELGVQMFDNIPSGMLSIPEENFKLLIE